MSISNIKTGQEQTALVLLYLHRFGWLTLEMLARLVWPEKSQSVSLCRRKIKILLEKNFIFLKKYDGINLYFLSSNGANYLNKNKYFIIKSSKTIKITNIHHRACSNWVLIEALIKGYQIHTEHEIQMGLTHLNELNGKIPDGLINTDEGIVWIEVENSWKNVERRTHLANFCKFALETKTDFKREFKDDYIFRVLIISITRNGLNNISNIFEKFYKEEYIKESTLSSIYFGNANLDNKINIRGLNIFNYYYDFLMKKLIPDD